MRVVLRGERRSHPARRTKNKLEEFRGNLILRKVRGHSPPKNAGEKTGSGSRVPQKHEKRYLFGQYGDAEDKVFAERPRWGRRGYHQAGM